MFRFTIRDVLWLTVVVALAGALCVQTIRHREAAQEAKNRLLENEYWAKEVLELDRKYRQPQFNEIQPPITK